jgi:hypothetical protein
LPERPTEEAGTDGCRCSSAVEIALTVFYFLWERFLVWEWFKVFWGLPFPCYLHGLGDDEIVLI